MAPVLSKIQNAALLCGLYLVTKRRRRRKTTLKAKRLWVRSWIERRNSRGLCSLLFDELKVEDPVSFSNFVRMGVENFEFLLEKVEPYIRKNETVMRESISPRNRLATVLRYLATGNSFQDMSFGFRIPETTLSQMIPEVCEAIYECLKDEYIKVPTSKEEWLIKINEFLTKWNCECLAALDGKHIAFRPLRSFGSMYRNYKKSDSIILLGLVDACYKFLFVDVGANGRCGDSGVYNKSDFKEALEQNSLDIPAPRRVNICGEEISMPYFIVADDAFALGKNIMKGYALTDITYAQRIFNYRISRARRVVENAFGLLAQKFQVLLTTIRLHDPDKVQKIVLACVALHNFLLSRNDSNYLTVGSVDEELPDGSIRPGSWRSAPSFEEPTLQDEDDEPLDDGSAASYKRIRDALKMHFLFEDPLPWQWKIVQPIRRT